MFFVYWLACSFLIIVVFIPESAGRDTTTSTDSTSTSEAKTTAASTTTSGTSSKTGTATHTVKVGPKESPHDYSPHFVKAGVGDVIVFEFYPRNHSVVKADYGSPSVPAEKKLFYSGIFNQYSDQNGGFGGTIPTWNVTVNDTNPTFYYCTAIDSCNKNGMVGAINPQSDSYPYIYVPGQSMPAEGSQPASKGGSSSSSSKLGGGAIAGIVIGSVAFLTILLAFCFVLGRNRVYQKRMSSENGRTASTARWAFFNNKDAGGPSSTQRSDIGNNDQFPDDRMSHPASPDPTQHSLYSPSQQGLYPMYGASSAASQKQQHHMSLDESVLGQPSPQSPYRPSQTEPSELEADNVRRDIPEMGEYR